MTYGNWLRLRRQWGSRFCRRSEDVGRCTSQSHTATRPACKLQKVNAIQYNVAIRAINNKTIEWADRDHNSQRIGSTVAMKRMQ